MDVALQVQSLKTQLRETLKSYTGKSRETVIGTTSFRREVLTDTVFALKDIADNLLNIVEKLKIENGLELKLEKLVLETLPEVVRGTMRDMKQCENGYALSNSNGTSPDEGANNKVSKVKHSLLIKPNTEGSSNDKFTNSSWAELVKNKLPPKLNNIPVSKSVLTQNGAGYILFPDVESRDRARQSLEDDFKIECNNKTIETIFPKMKITGIDGAKYGKGNCSELKEAILQKNSLLENLVNDQNKLFDVVFINDHANYAVIKVDPEIRSLIKKSGNRIFVDLTSCYVFDRLHLVQCYCCQEFGHKQGSEHCKSNKSPVCLYCAENHLSKNCPNKKDVSKHKCSNCNKSLNNAIKSKASGHTSTSDICPIVQNEAKSLMNRTMGMEKDPKNMNLRKVIAM